MRYRVTVLTVRHVVLDRGSVLPSKDSPIAETTINTAENNRVSRASLSRPRSVGFSD